MKGKTFSAVWSCNKTAVNVYSSRCENLLCEVLVRYKCLHNTYSQLFLKACYPFKLKGICKNVRHQVVHHEVSYCPTDPFFSSLSLSQLVIFRFIGSTSFSHCVQTLKHNLIAQHKLSSQNVYMCGGDGALCEGSSSNAIAAVVISKMARRMEVSSVIRFNLRFTMKLTQTLSTVHIEVDLKHQCGIRERTITHVPKILNAIKF